MIKIYQGKECLQGREKKLTRHGKVSFKVNRELIDMDITSLENSISKSKNKVSNENMKRIIEYLEKFKNRLNRNDKISLSWQYVDDILVSSPIDIMDFGLYGVRMCDYFVIDDGAFIRVTFEDIKDIIAFELMHEDLGYDFKRIENDLGDIGPIHTNDIKVLKELWENECEPYKDSLYMAIDGSSYVDESEDVIYDYTQRYKYKKDKYYEVVEKSCRRVMTQLLDSLLYTVSVGIKYKICDVNRDSFTLYIEDKNHINGMRAELNKSVCIQCVGRRFEVKPQFKTW